MNDDIKKLGSRIEMNFDRKRIDDKEAFKNLIGEVKEMKEQVSKSMEDLKHENNEEIRRSIDEISKIIKEKKFKVNVEAPKVIVPKATVEVLKETKEAAKAVDILEKVLLANLQIIKEQAKGIFIKNQSPSEAVSVVLSDAGRRDFYNAVSGAIASTHSAPFVKPDGSRAPANIDADGNLVVGLSLSDVEVSNFPDFYPLPEDQLEQLTPAAPITGYATEAKQDAGNASLVTIAGKDFATQTTLAAILAKIIAAPATEAKQDTGNTSLATIAGKDFATQTTLAAILAKIIAAPSTEAKQDALLAQISAIDFAMDSTLQDVYTQLVDVVNGLQNVAGIINVAEIRGPSTPISVTVNASSSTVVSANASRRGLYMVNTSTANQIITLRQTANAAVMWEGIVLYPGGVYQMQREDYHLNEIRAIASAAGGRLSIQEYT